MPPKPKAKPDEFDDEDQLEDDDFDDEEEPDVDMDADEIVEPKHKKPEKEKDDDEEDEDEDDILPADSDVEEDDVDVMTYQEDEDEVEPPVPEIIRNMTVIPTQDRTTSERLSIFECARGLGDRARHIDNGARPYIDITNCTSSLEIAYMELQQKRIPMAVIRRVGQNKVEIWRFKEMTLPKLPPKEWFMITIK